MDRNFVRMIEQIGWTDAHGHRLYGTAALLHVLHLRVSNIQQYKIDAGKAFIEKNLTT